MSAGTRRPDAGEGAERTEGHFVRLCKNCGRKVAPAEQLDGSFVATLDGERAVALEIPVGRQTGRLQGGPVAGVTTERGSEVLGLVGGRPR